jgi:dolichol-phosphate mannosyltransferase
MKYNLTIVFPCFNEENNLEKIISRCKHYSKEIEVIIVNNGSTDNSRSLIHKLLVGVEHIKYADIQENIGYGHGIMEGVRIASGEVIAWTHADLQTDPADVLEAYKIFVDHPEYPNCILKGRRVGRNPLDALFTGGMSILSSLLLRKHLSDVNAQPKMFHRDFLEKLTESPTDFSIDLYLLFQASLHGYTILEYPVHFGKRLYGESKGGGSLKGKWKLIRRTLSYMLKLKHDLER